MNFNAVLHEKSVETQQEFVNRLKFKSQGHWHPVLDTPTPKIAQWPLSMAYKGLYH